MSLRLLLGEDDLSDSLLAICGWLADKSPSRRLPLIAGLVALGGATIMLCLGSSIGLLVAGRFLQGLSAAVVWTAGLALLADTVGQEDIGQAMGYVSLGMSLAILVAPLLGGIVYARAGYYSVYYMAFGLIGIDIILRMALVETKVARKWIEGSHLQQTSSSLPTAPQNQDRLSTSKQSLPQISMADLAPNDQEKLSDPSTKPSSLPPILTLLSSRRLLAALWGCMVQALFYTAFDSVLALRVQALFGWTSIGAGLIFLALVVPSFIAPFVGHISDKAGPRWLVVGGFLLSCPIFVLLRLVNHDSLEQKILLCALLALLGACLTTVMTPLLAEIMYVVEAKEKKHPGIYGEKGAYAQAYGLFNTAFAIGTLLGPLWGGFVVAKAGWGTMTWTLGLLSILSVIPSLVFVGGLISRRHDDEARWNHNQAESEKVAI